MTISSVSSVSSVSSASPRCVGATFSSLQCRISPDARLPLLALCVVPLECRAAEARALARSLFDQLQKGVGHQYFEYSRV
jgi:hypothetical protein